MAERKVIIEVVINDDSVSSIEDLERAILAQDIYGQVAKKYLDSLQDDMIAQVDERYLYSYITFPAILIF